MWESLGDNQDTEGHTNYIENYLKGRENNNSNNKKTQNNNKI